MQFNQLLMALAVVGSSFMANALPTNPNLLDIPQDVAAFAEPSFVEKQLGKTADMEKRDDCSGSGGILEPAQGLGELLDDVLGEKKPKCSQESIGSLPKLGGGPVPPPPGTSE